MPRNIPITITREKMDAAPSRWPGAVSLSQGAKAALEAAEGSVRLLAAFVQFSLHNIRQNGSTGLLAALWSLKLHPTTCTQSVLLCPCHGCNQPFCRLGVQAAIVGQWPFYLGGHRHIQYHIRLA